MSTEVVMPQMGESIAEGTLSKGLKKVGDPVKREGKHQLTRTRRPARDAGGATSASVSGVMTASNKTELSNLLTYMDGKSGAEELVSKLLPVRSWHCESTWILLWIFSSREACTKVSLRKL